MKGYFSQLARRSGLSLETERTPDAVSARDQTPRAHAQNASAPRALHVDEVTFTSPSSPAINVTSEPRNFRRDDESEMTFDARHSNAGHSIQSEVSHSDSEPQSQARSPASIEISSGLVFDHLIAGRPTSESVPNEPKKSSPEKPSLEVERNEISIFEGPVHGTAVSSELLTRSTPRELQPPVPEINTKPSLAPEPETPELEVESRQRRPPADQTAFRETQMQSERDALAGGYLKEVIDWISTPWETGEREIESAGETEPLEKSNDRGSSGVKTRTQPSFQTSPDRDDGAQQLSLSIGTISIVVEEPRKEAQVSAVVPAPTEQVAERPTAQSTDLSRYYIRSW